MPLLDGIEATRCLRRMLPSVANRPRERLDVDRRPSARARSRRVRGDRKGARHGRPRRGGARRGRGGCVVIRLLICDASQRARARRCARLLDEQDEIEVVGEAADAEQAIALAAALSPDVVLLDAELPLADGEAATSRIKRLLPGVRIVALAGSADRQAVDAMIAAGADAYCVKGAPLWELERAIAGASDPLLRLAHALTRAPAGGVGAIVARELHDLTGGAVAAVYLASDGPGSGSPAPPVRSTSHELVRVPPAAVRAFEECAPVSADAGTLSELVVEGASFGDAFALPLVSDGLALGALLVAMPVEPPVHARRGARSPRSPIWPPPRSRASACSCSPARRRAATRSPACRTVARSTNGSTSCSQRAPRSVSRCSISTTSRRRTTVSVMRSATTCCARSRASRSARCARRKSCTGSAATSSRCSSRAARRRRTLSRGCVVRCDLHRRPRRLPTISAGIAVVAGRRPLEGRSARPRRPRALCSQTRRQGPDDGAHARSDDGARVLVVDDDGGLRELLRTTLEAIELEVEEADYRRARARLDQDDVRPT